MTYRLLLGLLAVFTIFQWTATALGSDRGQAGLVVGLFVVAATLTVERVWFGRGFVSAARALGLGAPHRLGVFAAAGLSLLLILVIPLFVLTTGAAATLTPDWFWLLPGLFAQAGIAEEVLFRGYLFGHLRLGRTFSRAAVASMIPFAVVHLYLFTTMAWPIALAAVLLAVVLSFPLAYLFELGGGSIWPPAIVHFVMQGAVKVVAISTGAEVFGLVWIAASAVMPMLVFLIPRPREYSVPTVEAALAR